MINYVFKQNFDPANTKECKPTFQLNYYDTGWTVKSDGIILKRYLMTNTSEPDFTNLANLTLVDTLRTNIIGFYAEDGSMLGFHYTDNFALHYTGYFYTDHVSGNQSYNFKIFGFGKVRVKFNNTRWIIGETGYIELDSMKANSGVFIAAAKTWYKIDVYYYSLLGKAGFSLLWTNGYYGYTRFIPVSAGVVTNNGAYLTGTEIPNVISVDREEAEGDVSSLTFSVPLTVSGSTTPGFYYNTFWDKYCHTTTNIALSKFRMVEFKAGYRPSTYPTDNDDLITKFVGHIESFKPIREEKEEKLEIGCVGFESFYKNSLNLNYPNLYDYWNACYAGKGTSDSSPDGMGCPTTFDGWQLHKAFQTISIRANIDPYLFMKKRLLLNSSNIVVSGTWLIEETSPSSVTLDTAFNYGSSMVIGSEVSTTNDDEYIIKSNFGDFLFDYINTITDVYGWKWGCNPYYDGAPYLKSNNNPFEIYTVKVTLRTNGTYDTSDGYEDTFPYGVYILMSGFTYPTDLDAVSGKYACTDEAGYFLDIIWKGSKANLIIATSSTGSGYEGTIIACNSDKTEVTLTDATNFSANQIVIIETHNGEESKIIQSKSSNTLTLTTALTNNPVKDGYIRTATFSAEIRRGLTWATATPIQTTYHSCCFMNDYNRLILPNGYKELTPNSISTTRCYYAGIDPKTSLNPTNINLVSGLSYDDYIVRLTRLTDAQAGATNNMRIDALFAYDRDVNKVVKTFYTGDSVVSGTVISFNVEDSGVDQRNDTLVVGRRLGVEVPGSASNRILNPNNPTFEFIMSRATDTASIYDPNVKNYVGVPRQTIQIAPEISSVDRANYWAVSFIDRYRYPKRYPSFVSLFHPLMEKGDCICVYDEGRRLLNLGDKFWITSIKDTYEKMKFLSTYTTTTYEPWESYTPRPEIDTDDYSGLPVVNLSITNGGTIAVPYDPYSNDATGTKIVIKYDLTVDVDIKIDILPAEQPGKVVTTLLNPTGSNGPVGWQKQDIGKNYVVTWDGVDLYGDWNKYASQGDTEEVGTGFFAHEGKLNTYGKFYIRFTVVRRSNAGIQAVLLSTDTTMLDDNGYIYTKRSNPSSVDLTSKVHLIVRTGGEFTGRDFTSPQVNFNDSDTTDDGVPLVAKIIVTDTSQNTAMRILSTTAGGFGSSCPISLENNLANRKIQLKLIGYNLLFIHARWTSGFGGFPLTATRIVIPWKHEFYKDNSFVHYGSGNYDLARCLNMKSLGYSYSKYKDYIDDDLNFQLTWAQSNSALVYLGWYVWVQIEAIDKSGRKVLVRTPNTAKNNGSTMIPNTDGMWFFWLDDQHPYPTSVSNPDTNSTGYEWISIPASDFTPDVVFNDSEGRNLFNLATPGNAGNNIYMVQVEPKLDRYDKTWGY